MLILLSSGTSELKTTLNFKKAYLVNLLFTQVDLELLGCAEQEEVTIKKDQNGNVIISKLDEKTLQEAALISGGTYVRSTTGDMDLDQIYTKGIKVSLEARTYGESRQKIWYERFQWFISLAAGLLFVEFLLKEFRQKREANHEL